MGEPTAQVTELSSALPPTYTLYHLVGYALGLGTWGFGGPVALVGYMHRDLVKRRKWGPVVITVGFIGFLVANFWGVTVVAVATFLPCYFFTIIPAPYFKRHGKQPGLVAFVDGVTAAAIGAIAGAVVVLGRRTLLVDGWQPEIVKIALFFITLAVLLRFKKLPEPLVVLVAAVLGLILYPLMQG